jgi:hypothetical protein
LRGTVAKRQFEDDRVTVAGFVFELPDGSRDFIGVSLDTHGLTLNASGLIIRGLQTLLDEGNVVDITAKSCDGYFVILNAVRSTSVGTLDPSALAVAEDDRNSARRV